MRLLTFAGRVGALAMALGIGATAVGAGVASAETGTITFVNLQKGYGFITDDATGETVFVQVATLERSQSARQAGLDRLNGRRVSFLREADRRGLRPATNVEIIESAAAVAAKPSGRTTTRPDRDKRSGADGD